MTRSLTRWTRRIRAVLTGRHRTAPASPARAAHLYLTGHAFPEIASLLHTRQADAAELLHKGLVDAAVDRLQQLLGEHGEDWLDARVSDYVDQDLLDPDDALFVVALGVASDDAIVLAEPDQQWTLRPEYTAASLDIAEAISIDDRDGGQIDLTHDSGRHEYGVDVSLLTRCYRLARWDRADQEVP